MGTHSRIRGLLFDKDGTILDFDKMWAPINIEVATYASSLRPEARDRLLAACGYEAATGKTRPGSIFAVAGITDTLAFITAEMDGHVPSDMAAVVADLYTRGGSTYAAAIDGVGEALHVLKRRGYRLGIATNDTAGGLEASMTRSGLLSLFEFAAGCDSGHGAKPAPGMIHAFCKVTSLKANEVAMIGDSAHDMETAHRAPGVLRVAVLSGTGTQEDLGPVADVVLTSVADLPAWLERA